jgi:hypothetical protein
MEDALKLRDGLRSKGSRVALAEAIMNHARTSDASAPAGSNLLIPPEGVVSADNIAVSLVSFVRKGGDMTTVKARMLAAYAFPDDADKRARCEAAFTPHKLTEKEGGNRFSAGVAQHRPGWSHESSVKSRRKSDDEGPSAG